METPAVRVKRIILMDAGHDVYEVFVEDVRVPVEKLIHEEGQGWSVANERMNSGRISGSKRENVSESYGRSAMVRSRCRPS